MMRETILFEKAGPNFSFTVKERRFSINNPGMPLSGFVYVVDASDLQHHYIKRAKQLAHEATSRMDGVEDDLDRRLDYPPYEYFFHSSYTYDLYGLTIFTHALEHIALSEISEIGKSITKLEGTLAQTNIYPTNSKEGTLYLVGFSFRKGLATHSCERNGVLAACRLVAAL